LQQLSYRFHVLDILIVGVSSVLYLRATEVNQESFDLYCKNLFFFPTTKSQRNSNLPL